MRQGQMLLITSVVISLIMLSTGAAIAGLGDQNYRYMDEAYTSEMLKDEASNVDMRFQQERKNFRKMVKSLDSYNTEVIYWGQERCFNVTLRSSSSRVNLNCIS